MKSKLVLICLLWVAASASAQQTQQVYSWTDGNGVAHYSDTPPPKEVTNAKRVNMHSGGTTTAPVPSQEVVEKPAETPKGGGPSMARAAGYSEEDIKRNCGIARQNLKTLEGAQKAMAAVVAPGGQPEASPEDKARDQQIEKARQQVGLFCEK